MVISTPLMRILPLVLMAAIVLAAPALAWCTDFDGGQDPYVKGTVTSDTPGSIGSPATDTCITGGTGPSGVVAELYCEGDTVAYVKIPCTDACVDGVCASTGVKCADSDGGKDYSKKGKITTKLIGDIEDYCDTAMPGRLFDTLYEFSCFGSAAIGEERHTCAKGCKDGACIPDCPEMTKTCPDGTPLEVRGDCTFPDCPKAGLCTDTDSGKVYGTRGIATSTWKPKEDSPDSTSDSDHCRDTILVEGYCLGALSTSEEHPCSQGCQNGACIGEAGCSIEGAACSAKEGMVCCAELTCELLPDKDQDVGNCVAQGTQSGTQRGGTSLFARFFIWLKSLFG